MAGPRGGAGAVEQGRELTLACWVGSKWLVRGQEQFLVARPKGPLMFFCESRPLLFSFSPLDLSTAMVSYCAPLGPCRLTGPT